MRDFVDSGDARVLDTVIKALGSCDAVIVKAIGFIGRFK